MRVKSSRDDQSQRLLSIIWALAQKPRTRQWLIHFIGKSSASLTRDLRLLKTVYHVGVQYRPPCSGITEGAYYLEDWGIVSQDRLFEIMQAQPA